MRRRVAGHKLLDRRWVVGFLVTGAVVALRAPGRRAVGQGATPTASQSPELAQLFPDQLHLPAGLELESSGTREEIGQLAGTFRNSRDAAQLLAEWGWVGNAYRSYAASAGADRTTPARVEISLHQFANSTGAAYALSYFAHDRAVALRHHEELSEFLLPCEAMVTGDASATRYLRRGNLVVRVTVAMPMPVGASATSTALATATDLALAVLTKAGEPESARVATCE